MEAIENFLKSNVVYSLLVVFLIFYGPRLAPRLSDWVLKYFKHPLFRFFVIFLLLFMGCESFFPKYEKQLFSQQDALIQEIDNSVDLSKTQKNIARSALMAKKELHPHPYSLW